jgi:hypothetical protein
LMTFERPPILYLSSHGALDATHGDGICWCG